ncbi:unnamed protein product [Dracunculus medinensis]|uniref:Uncharacterized protein n=1 Tax=Dracunculus medinensis TaxID=318479 RepID=A0A158Q6D6_DRAME|nr:unnamed protein product [Dracunculus medinensis]
MLSLIMSRAIANGLPEYLSHRNGIVRKSSIKTLQRCTQLPRKNTSYPIISQEQYVQALKALLRLSQTMYLQLHVTASPISFQLCRKNIFLNDGEGLISNLDNTDMVKLGKCITNTSIVLWNSTDVVNHCPYRRVGKFETMRYGDHFIINELQASFVLDKKDNTTITTNCRLTNPYLMKETSLKTMKILRKNQNEKQHNSYLWWRLLQKRHSIQIILVFLRSLFCFSRERKSNPIDIIVLPTESKRTQVPVRLNTFSYRPEDPPIKLPH